VALLLAAGAVVAGSLAVGLEAPAGEPPRRTPPATATAAPHPAPAAPATTAAVATTATPTTTTELAMPTPPPLGWSTCAPDRQCSTLVVPIDYAAPSGADIGIALRRRPASDPAQRIGSLMLNPGGPGGSGIATLDQDLSLLPGSVLDHFDVIAFDPRGVGASDALHCTGDAHNGPDPDPDPQTPAEVATLLAADRSYAAACARAGGALLAHLGTADVARDMEELRIAVGDGGLTYLGISYGTFLGAQYAVMFPTHVRAMVLDAAIDPSLTTEQLADAQAQGFEQALEAFFGWCRASGCSWRPAGDPHAAFQAIAASLRAHPLVVGSQTLGAAQFYTGTFGTLYARSFWPSLARGLAAAAAGNGAPMLGLYNGYEHAGDPTFDGDTNNAITCLDHPVPTDPAVYDARAARAAAVAPDFGALFAWGGLTCAVWPVPDSARRVPAPAHAPGSPPIMVVGTTGDPATPYAWAQALASQLEHGVLLTRVGQDHVAIFYSSCVRSWDAQYLVSLQTPPAGTVCPS
jgi:pimeloyl-ACP methyl ester carboxylesterase